MLGCPATNMFKTKSCSSNFMVVLIVCTAVPIIQLVVGIN